MTQMRFEIEQQKLAASNLRQENNYKVEQLRNKLIDIKELIEKQEREAQKLTTRIAQRKQEFEARNARKNELITEIEAT